MLLAYPARGAYWREALDRVQRRPGFADSLILDVYRLRRTVGVLAGADQYMAMAELALRAGYPGEARRVLDEGFRRNFLGGVSPEGAGHRRLRDAVCAHADDHEKGIRSRDGNVLAAIGFALALDEQTERSVVLLEQAVVQSGLASPDDVRFRLGLAQLWAGHRSDARKTLRAVRSEDGTKELARLWLLVADNVK